MLAVYFIRHGEVHNPEGIIYHRRPGFLLSPRGQREAQAAAEFLRSAGVQLEILFHSPMERTLQTAEIINAAQEAPLQVSELMHEWDEGESPQAVQARVRQFWEELATARWQTVGVVSHRDAIRPLMLFLSGDPDPNSMRDPARMPLPTGGIYRVRPAQGATPPEVELVFEPRLAPGA